jgi:Flp pilus assembly protein TadG
VVEFALVLPLLFLILMGLWEVGRITEVEEVMWNSAREAGRDSSLGQEDLLTVATNLRNYLQAAEPTAFGKGHSTSLIAPVVTLPPNTTGYTCWDNTANRELFTMTFSDLTEPSVTDPTAMAQLDIYQVNVQVPYGSIGWVPVPQITGITRLNAGVTWTAMVDSPFTVAPSLPAE